MATRGEGIMRGIVTEVPHEALHPCGQGEISVDSGTRC